MSDLSRLGEYSRKRFDNGDLPDAERALWYQIWSEVDAYLTDSPGEVVVTGPDLFEESGHD
jgi:hypothetical protein